MKKIIKNWIFFNIIYKYFHEYLEITLHASVEGNIFEKDVNNFRVVYAFPKLKALKTEFGLVCNQFKGELKDVNMLNEYDKYTLAVIKVLDRDKI